MGYDPADILTVVLAAGVPLALLIAALRYRRLWRTARRQVHDEQPLPTSQQLLHAVDAIAIEVERVSEGQRYLTKVLAERERSGARLPDQKAREE